MFSFFHRNYLIYNTSWEDPRIDRKLLNINNETKLLMITGAGDNCLDYLIDDPEKIDTVDLNFRQNGLFNFKKQLYLNNQFELLEEIFSNGNAAERDTLNILFDGLEQNEAKFLSKFLLRNQQRSIYQKGTTGFFSRLLNQHLKRNKLMDEIDELFSFTDLDYQIEHYNRIEDRIWDDKLSLMFNSGYGAPFLGIPKFQYNGARKGKGILNYLKDALRSVFTNTLAADNYFWQVYFYGSYSRNAKPNYLKSSFYHDIKDRLHKVNTHSKSLVDHLISTDESYSHFVLLDHMDWVNDSDSIIKLWKLILDHAECGAKVLFRSVHKHRDFLPSFVEDHFYFVDDITNKLHKLDRVGTYGSTQLAILK